MSDGIVMTELEARIHALERARFHCPSDVRVDDSMRRARRDVETKGLYSATWKWVPPSYYQWPLSQRAQTLGAASTHLLCKSLVMDNKCVNGTKDDDPTHPKFVLVVLQYEATLDVRKLSSAIRALRSNVKDRLDYSQFDFRVASPEDNARLTGYAFNSVTPFGLLQKVPIVLSEAVVPLRFFWMGGGHEHLKLGMAVSEFCEATRAIVANISHPRNGGDDDDSTL